MTPAVAAATQGRVLVIDDDELATALLKQTLETAGFSVWTLLSPVGASQLIERMGIQAAVVDVNMPVITGDRLVKLLRGWDPFKRLPIVLVSGMPAAKLAEIAKGLPDVSVITKAKVAAELPDLIRKAIGAAPQPGGGNQPSVARPVRVGEASDSFVKQLPDQMAQAMMLWERVCLGKQTERVLLRGLLHTMKGQSHLLGLERVAELFGLILDIVTALLPDTIVDDTADASVARAFGVLAGLSRAPAGSLEKFDPGATLEHLSHIRDRLLAR